jgi:Flp pilus assembly protein TadB
MIRSTRKSRRQMKARTDALKVAGISAAILTTAPFVLVAVALVGETLAMPEKVGPFARLLISLVA